MKILEMNEEQLEKLPLNVLYLIREEKYREFYGNIEKLILKYYPKASTIEEAIDKIEYMLTKENHRKDEGLVSIMHLINDFQSQRNVTSSNYRKQEQIEDAGSLKNFVNATRKGFLSKSLRRNEMCLRRLAVMTANQETIYKSFNKEKQYVEQFGKNIKEVFTERKLKSYGIEEKDFNKYSFDEVQLIMDVCDKKFSKILHPDVIKNVKSGLKKEDLLQSICPTKEDSAKKTDSCMVK